jgi:hypothetical protein
MSYGSFCVVHSNLENQRKNAVEDRRRQIGGLPLPSKQMHHPSPMATSPPAFDLQWRSDTSLVDRLMTFAVLMVSLILLYMKALGLLLMSSRSTKNSMLFTPRPTLSYNKLQVDAQRSQPPTAVYTPLNSFSSAWIGLSDNHLRSVSVPQCFGLGSLCRGQPGIGQLVTALNLLF